MLYIPVIHTNRHRAKIVLYISKSLMRKFIIILILLHTVFAVLYAQNSEQNDRQIINQNGKWAFRFDKENAGLKEKWQDKRTDENWRTITVPSTYNIYFPDKYYYFAPAWYKKTLKINKEQLSGKRILLHIGAAGSRSILWVNGQKVGEHISAYTEFKNDITPFVHQGDNQITVRTDNSIDKNSVPDRYGWWPYGGLYRDVYLEIVPQVYVDNIWFETRQGKEGKWDFTAGCAIVNSLSGSQSVNVEFVLKKNDKIIWSDSKEYKADKRETTVKISGTLPDIKKWSPRNPELYQLTAIVRDKNITHSRTINTAFREIKTEGTKILLNGRQLVVKGINYHEDHPKYGNALSREQTKKDVLSMKALGVNLIRGAHYTHNHYFYDLCDSLGILVWAEIPAWQTDVKLLADASIWKRYLKPQLNEMVMQYRRHPSIVIWSVGNEFDSSKKDALTYVTKAVNYVRSLDTTRLMTFASDRHQRNDDLCFKEVDFIAINEYYGWYYGNLYGLGSTLDRLHNAYPNKPIIVSEFNAAAALDSVSNENHCAISGKQYTLEYQNKFLTIHLDQIYYPERQNYVAGGIIWLYNDFADVHRSGGSHPKQWTDVNLKGLVNQNRQHKPSYDLVKNYYHCIKEPLPQVSKILISQTFPSYIRETNKIIYPIGNKNIKWHKAKTDGRNAVNLLKQSEIKKNCHIYAAAEIISERDMDTKLLFGHNDGAVIWLNGKKIYQDLKENAFVYNQHALPIKLKKGKNLLVLQLSQSGGGWGFNFNLTAYDVSFNYPDF